MSNPKNIWRFLSKVVGNISNPLKPQDFESAPPESGKPEENGISIKWFGAAAYRIEYRGEVLWIDPYFSREHFTSLRNKILQPKISEIDRYMDRADFVAIGHSHYDHAGDLPYIVPKFGPKVFGSASVGNLFKTFALPENKFEKVTGGDSVRAGAFKIDFIRSEHGKLMGKRPFDYDISSDTKPPLKAKAFGCGEVFNILVEVGGRKIYHQGSGGLIEENLEGRNADVAIIGISSRKATPKMVFRVVSRLKPQIVIPSHYDQFFYPLDNGMMLIPGLDFNAVVNEIKLAAPNAEIVAIPLCGEYWISAK